MYKITVMNSHLHHCPVARTLKSCALKNLSMTTTMWTYRPSEIGLKNYLMPIKCQKLRMIRSILNLLKYPSNY